MDPSRASGLKALLGKVLAPDTQQVQAATDELKQNYYKDPAVLAELISLMNRGDEGVDIRQLAATEARKLVPRHWNKLPDDFKQQGRSHLLAATTSETKPALRHSTARVVAAIAKVDSEDGQWPELPSALIEGCQSQHSEAREVYSYLLFSVLDVMADESSTQFAALFDLFSKTLQDPESGEVRINTMLALSKMAYAIDTDEDQQSLQSFQKLVPGMVGILQQTVDARDEGRILQAFEVFQTLLECDPKLLTKHFGDLVQYMLKIASDTSVEKDARVAALNFLVSCVLYRKNKFQALRIGDKVAEILFNILFSIDDTPGEEEEFSVTLSVLSLLNLMSSTLAPSQAAVPVIQLFKKYASNPEPRQRQAALTAFASTVEGAPEFVDTQMNELRPMILHLLNDPEIKVREAAVSATKELADSLPEALAKDHQNFMAALAKNLNAGVSGLDTDSAKISKSIVVHCCTAIDAICNGLEPKDLQGYLSDLVPHLSQLFSHPDLKVKAGAIGAVGSIAESAKGLFQPYFQQTMNALSSYVTIKETEDDLNLRSITIDAMGDIALAVGPEQFQRYVTPLMQSTEEGLNLDNPRIKETSYMFWGTLAKVYQSEFKPFLPGTVQTIFKVLEQHEENIDLELGDTAGDLVGSEVVIGGKKVKVVGGDDDRDADIEDIDPADMEDDDEWDDISGISAIAEEKEIALEALAEIFSNTGSEFLPFFEKTIHLSLSLLEHPYEGCRRAAVSALFRAYGSLWQVSGSTWEPGLPLKVKPTAELAKLGEVIMTGTLALWMAEDDRAVVLEVNRNLGETFKLCGPALLAQEGVPEQLVQTLIAILEKKHVCQQAFDEEEDSGEFESSEDEMWLIDTALDCMTGVAAALGTQFGEAWKMFEKIVLGYASATESSSRSAAVGAIADATKGMKGGVTPYTAGLLKVILHRLGDEDTQVKSNAAFAAGMLVECSDSDKDIIKAFPTILQKLEPLLHTQESRQLDNAAGCVSRMIMKHPDEMPLEDVLPALVKLLPLKEDYEENAPVYQNIVQLYKSNDSTIQSLTPQLMPIINEVMGEPEEQLDDETRTALTQLAKYIQSKKPDMIRPHANLVAATQS